MLGLRIPCKFFITKGKGESDFGYYPGAVDKALKDAGATNIIGCITHALFSRDAVSLIKNSVIQKLVFTDTVLLPKEKMKKRRSKLNV